MYRSMKKEIKKNRQLNIKWKHLKRAQIEKKGN